MTSRSKPKGKEEKKFKHPRGQLHTKRILLNPFKRIFRGFVKMEPDSCVEGNHYWRAWGKIINVGTVTESGFMGVSSTKTARQDRECLNCGKAERRYL